jgi:hypothetical protein
MCFGVSLPNIIKYIRKKYALKSQDKEAKRQIEILLHFK